MAGVKPWIHQDFLLGFSPEPDYLFAWERICAISGRIRSFVARVTAGVDPGMQNMAFPWVIPAIARDSMDAVPIS